MKAVVAAFNQEKALVWAFSVIVQPVVEPMDRFAALVMCPPVPQSTQSNLEDLQQDGGQRTYSDIPIINSVICIARVRTIGNSVMLLYTIIPDF